jgi:tetratricopeptide (TPR) repeat protein
VSRVRLATILERNGSLDEAIPEYATLIDKIKNSSVRFSMLQSLGGLYERRQRMDEAVQCYDKALKEEAGAQYRAALLFRIVRIKREAGDVETVVAVWEKAIAVQPDVEYACRWRLQLAHLCAESERAPKARTLCQEILSISKADGTRKEASKLMETLPGS